MDREIKGFYRDIVKRNVEVSFLILFKRPSVTTLQELFMNTPPYKFS